eukprot:Mrub_05381.p1 GENE.Mrub_05381~~Mrub_05381.p1  ORF type:complete len:367 (-),score=90.56 Mrub_05381:38-1075(-)
MRQNELVVYNRKLRSELEKLVNEDKVEMAKLKAVEYLEKQRQIQQFELIMHLSEIIEQYNSNGYTESKDKLKNVETESKFQGFVYAISKVDIKDYRQFIDGLKQHLGKDYVKECQTNQNKLVDELILKTFKDSHIDCNHIDELINKISNPDDKFEDWKQNPNQYTDANWNYGTTNPDIMDQVLQQQSNKDQSNLNMNMNMNMNMNGMDHNVNMNNMGMPMGMNMGMSNNQGCNQINSMGMPVGMGMQGNNMGMPDGMGMQGNNMGMPEGMGHSGSGGYNGGGISNINDNNYGMVDNSNANQINSLNNMGGGVLSSDDGNMNMNMNNSTSETEKELEERLKRLKDL